MLANGDTSPLPAEIQWLHDSVDINYQVILDIRNESAVAALALHEWQLYTYNNKVYTQLFKELSADNTLTDYCRIMQQSQSNKRIAIILLVVILLLIVPAYYMLYYRHRLYERHCRERMQLDNLELADDELHRVELEDSKLHVANSVLDNCLSALKHETMYYPSHIRQLVDKGDVGSLSEVTLYYRELYGMLSAQAMRQVEQVKMHVSRTTFLGHPVLGNDNMLRYLADILKPQTVEAQQKDDHYIVFTITRQEPCPSNSKARKASFVTRFPRQRLSVLPMTSCRSGVSSRNSSPTWCCSTWAWAVPLPLVSKSADRPRRCILR